MPRPDSYARCPVCTQGVLTETDQVTALRDVLARWTEIIGPEAAAGYTADYAAQSDVEFTLQRCGQCGFGQFTPAIAGTAGFYAAITATDYYTAEKWEFAQAIRDLCALGVRRVLDAGCGSGHFLRQLRAACPHLLLAGHDTNTALLEAVAADGFETVTMRADPTGEMVLEPFDAVCLFQVIEHVTEPLAFLAGVLALVKPGGTLIITAPNAAGPIRSFPDALTELPPHHLTQWTEPAFRAMLSRFGLETWLVRHEPLPDYLWSSYLPVQWDAGIWPAMIFDPVAKARGLTDRGARLQFAAEQLRELGLTQLAGVPGHTVYVLARVPAAVSSLGARPGHVPA